MGLTMTPAAASMTEMLPADEQGVASALNDTTREVGGAVGVALLGSILTAGYRASIESSLTGLPGEVVDVAGEGIGSAMAVARDAGADGPVIIAAAQHALVDGWVQAMWIGVAVAAVPLLYLIFRGPRREATSRTATAVGMP